MKGVIDAVSDIVETYCSKFAPREIQEPSSVHGPEIEPALQRSRSSYFVFGNDLERRLNKEGAYVHPFSRSERAGIEDRLKAALPVVPDAVAFGHISKSDKLHGSLLVDEEGYVLQFLYGATEFAVVFDETGAAAQAAHCIYRSESVGDVLHVKYEVALKNGKKPLVTDRGEELRLIPHKRWHEFVERLKVDLRDIADEYRLPDGSLKVRIAMVDEVDRRFVKPDGGLVMPDKGTQISATSAHIDITYTALADDVRWDGPVEDSDSVNAIMTKLLGASQKCLNQVFGMVPKRPSASSMPDTPEPQEFVGERHTSENL